MTSLGRHGSFSDYIYAVEIYTSRELRFHSDMLNAFSGVSSLIEERLDTSMLHGLPIRYLDLAILWYGHGSLERRSEFPSWSWAGWTGGVYMSHLRGMVSGRERDRMRVKYYLYCKEENQFKPSWTPNNLDSLKEPQISMLFKRLRDSDNVTRK